jgi:uncharacterized damage-inducible protein DinB
VISIDLYLSGSKTLDLSEQLRRQFSYDAWANSQVLAGIKSGELQGSLPRPLQLLAHILSAERLWLERIKQQPQSFAVWPEFSVEQCEAQLKQLERMWPEYLSQISSSMLSNEITYKNTKGESWSSTVNDILTHVLLHSAYHRGQVAILMRNSGVPPAYTDFIHAVRQGCVE